MPCSRRAALARSRACGGRRALSRTPARSSFIGTRTLTLVWLPPEWVSSASTKTRRYFARGLSASPFRGSDDAGSRSSAAIRRSASSALILPSESICKIWRRFSLIRCSSIDVDKDGGIVRVDFEVRASKAAQDAQRGAQGRKRIHVEDDGRDEQHRQNDDRERQHQEPKD